MNFLIKRNKMKSSVASKLQDIVGKSKNPAYSPFQQKSPFESTVAEPKSLTVTDSKLDNGVTIVTENSGIGSTVHLGLLLNVGSRDESPKTSGSLHSIMTCFYKSFKNTNETINYGMVQMSGGKYTMNYTRESALF